MEVLYHWNLTDCHFLGYMTDQAFSNDLIPCELQWTLDASGIELSAMRNHVRYMVRGIQIPFGGYISTLGMNGHTSAWESHECDQQFGENESMDIGNSQRHRKEGNARINNVLAMKPGLPKIIEKVHISRNFESPASDRHIGTNIAGLITETPGRWKEFIVTQKGKLPITVLPILMWREGGILSWSWVSEPTAYENWSRCCSTINKPLMTSYSLQPWMNWSLSSMYWSL